MRNCQSFFFRRLLLAASSSSGSLPFLSSFERSEQAGRLSSNKEEGYYLPTNEGIGRKNTLVSCNVAPIQYLS